MPNWCNNFLKVTGPEEEVRRFMEVCKSSNPNRTDDDELFTFEGIAPICGQKYDKAVQAWGTKWGADIYRMVCTENMAAIDFSTAWNPPEQWFEKACEAFPSLTFVLKFYQTGVGFAGYYKANSDRITKQVYYDWNEIAVFLYGNHDYGWGFDTTCSGCFQRSVELEDIIRQGETNYHLCSDCIKRQQEDGGTA